MAVGVVFAGAEQGAAGLSVASAVAISLGIAIQNIPEGAIISMPLSVSATGIKEVETEGQPDIWHDLCGRRLSGKPTKRGIYIVGGKKVLINN